MVHSHAIGCFTGEKIVSIYFAFTVFVCILNYNTSYIKTAEKQYVCGNKCITRNIKVVALVSIQIRNSATDKIDTVIGPRSQLKIQNCNFNKSLLGIQTYQ